jgi:hypothetical protein
MTYKTLYAKTVLKNKLVSAAVLSTFSLIRWHYQSSALKLYWKWHHGSTIQAVPRYFRFRRSDCKLQACCCIASQRLELVCICELCAACCNFCKLRSYFELRVYICAMRCAMCEMLVALCALPVLTRFQCFMSIVRHTNNWQAGIWSDSSRMQKIRTEDPDVNGNLAPEIWRRIYVYTQLTTEQERQKWKKKKKKVIYMSVGCWTLHIGGSSVIAKNSNLLHLQFEACTLQIINLPVTVFFWGNKEWKWQSLRSKQF